jgi:hypothetical protein
MLNLQTTISKTRVEWSKADLVCVLKCGLGMRGPTQQNKLIQYYGHRWEKGGSNHLEYNVHVQIRDLHAHEMACHV